MKVVLGLVLSLVASSTVRADFLSGATGHTTVKNQATGEIMPGIINFAVLDRRGGSYGDTWGTRFDHLDLQFENGGDSPRLDTGARYLYLYQVTNNGQQTSFNTAAVGIVVPPSRITSWGWFRDAGFADYKKTGETGQYLEVSATNNFGLTVATTPGKPSLVVYYPRVVPIGQGKDAGLNPFDVYLSTKAVRALWAKGNYIAPGRRGTIYGFTSDLPPGFDKGIITHKCGLPQQPPCPK